MTILNNPFKPNGNEGVLISLEGADCSGKSTIAEAIEESYPDAVVTYEPSDLETGDVVREYIRDEGSDPWNTFLAFLHDRRNHIVERIRPALEDGKLVVSDRYMDSTLAYQPIALEDELQFPQRYIERVMRPWTIEPDATIYLKIDIETSMDRIDGKDIYEKREFLERVIENYEHLSKRFSKRYNIVDANRPVNRVVEDSLAVVSDHYGG